MRLQWVWLWFQRHGLSVKHKQKTYWLQLSYKKIFIYKCAHWNRRNVYVGMRLIKDKQLLSKKRPVSETTKDKDDLNFKVGKLVPGSGDPVVKGHVGRVAVNRYNYRFPLWWAWSMHWQLTKPTVTRQCPGYCLLRRCQCMTTCSSTLGAPCLSATTGWTDGQWYEWCE